MKCECSIRVVVLLEWLTVLRECTLNEVFPVAYSVLVTEDRDTLRPSY